MVQLKEERALNEIPENYPKGSRGIIINGDKFVVDNSVFDTIATNKSEENIVKEDNLKYNPYFLLKH